MNSTTLGCLSHVRHRNYVVSITTLVLEGDFPCDIEPPVLTYTTSCVIIKAAKGLGICCRHRVTQWYMLVSIGLYHFPGDISGLEYFWKKNIIYE